MTAIASASLVVLSVFFGWLSFRFQEAGSSAAFAGGDPHLELDLPGMMLRQARSCRARQYARLLFNLAALCLLTSIPLGYGNNGPDLAIFAVASGVVLGFTIFYAAQSLHNMWQQMRKDAFDAFYIGGKLWWLYRNEKAVRRLYLSVNPLPFSALFGRDWEANLTHPTTEQLLETNEAEGG